jgi:hypothetical protein
MRHFIQAMHDPRKLVGDTSVWDTSARDHRVPTPPPLPLHVATEGKNHLNEEITPLLPTLIGERNYLTVVARHLFLLCFPPRLPRDLLFPTHVVHM